MKIIIKNFILFLFYGALYFIIETLWKGHLTHWSMFILGGVIGVLIGSINEYISWDLSFWKQCLIGTSITTLLEGISGIILNVWLKLNIWDYSVLPLNFFYHQCCIQFCCAWFLLSGFCIVLDDFLRWKIFNEEFPHYSI